MIKKILQEIFKKVSYGLYTLLYGKITKSINIDSDERIISQSISKNIDFKYKIYLIKKGRLYTDRIQDTAVLLDNYIINGPSFQFRENVNSEINSNIVFKKGTPRKLKKINGKVLSLLTGGAGNNNYWHWMYDVIPRLGICSEKIDLNNINYFLVPSLDMKFQKETLLELGISLPKILSSEKYRHIIADELLITDHPYAHSDQPSKDIHNIPKWISLWLKEKFLKNKNVRNKNFPKKIYIDRGDSISNVAKLRTIINEDEVKNFLKEKGFKSMRLSELHFLEQVKLFNEAEFIIGLHGAAFANMAFCKTNTKVLEIKNTTADKVIENLAHTNSLKFSSIMCEPLAYNFSNQLGHIKVPINILEEKIKNI